LNVEYLYLRHTSPRSERKSRGVVRYHGHAPLVGFASALMTLSKTALYWLQGESAMIPVDEADFKNGIVAGVWLGTTLQQSSGVFGLRRMGELISVCRRSQLTCRTWLLVPFVICVVLGSSITRTLNRQFADDVAYVEWAHQQSSGSVAAKEVEAEDQEGKQGSSPAKLGCKGKRPSPLQAFTTSSGATGTKTPSIYPEPVLGAALPLTFHPQDANILVIGNNRLAATRTLTFLESDASVVIASSQPLSAANDELQYRVEQGQARFSQFDADTPQQWTKFLSENDITLICITDTMIGSSRRPESSALAISRAAASLHIPINVSDQPTLSTYTFPAVHRFKGVDGPSHLQVAVSTNGHGCRLSGRIKREIVSKLPPNVGAAVDNIGKLRIRAKSKDKLSDDDNETPLNSPVFQLDTPSLLRQASYKLENPVDDDEQLRRMRWVHQMSEYYSFEQLARMTDDDLLKALDTWKDDGALPHHENGSSDNTRVPTQKGRISLIGSGPGHPSLLTVAALHSLKNATLILSDKLVPSEILALIPPTTKLHIAKKFPGNNEGAQNEMMVQALEGARAGHDVVRLKQGDPFVYGRGGEEVLYFRENGYESTVIPGISSALAGPLMMGIPVTQRGVAESMIMCTGVGRMGKSVQLPGFLKSRTTCILMGVARIGSIVTVLTGDNQPGRDGAAYPSYLPIAIIERASSPDQRVILSTLANIEDALKSVEERPPGMMIVGWAAMCLEGKGRVDILDTQEEVVEAEISEEWLQGQRWKMREGLEGIWGEFMKTVEGVQAVSQV
jgi:uroporphyrin-III C-methyltransferase